MNRLRSCREHSGYSQKQVAIEIGVKPPTVSQWEAGVKNPSSENYIKLARLYGVSVDYIMGKDDECNQDAIRFSQDERQLIELYRSLNAESKKMLIQVAITFAGNPSAQEGLIQKNSIS